MTFNRNWEALYHGKIDTASDQRHICKWPWTEVVSYVMRYFMPGRKQGFSVLEIGCGAGPNIPFFKSLGGRYFGLDGSESIITQLHGAYPDLQENLVAGDFTQSIPFDGPFDLILDRGSLTHNSTGSIENCINLVYPLMKTGGLFIVTGLQSTDSGYYQIGGDETDDPYSRENFTQGPFTGTGLVHFADKKHILELFYQFEIIVLEHIVITQEIPDDQPAGASWSFVAKK